MPSWLKLEKLMFWLKTNSKKDDALVNARLKSGARSTTMDEALAKGKNPSTSITDDFLTEVKVPLLIKTNTPEDLSAMKKVESWVKTGKSDAYVKKALDLFWGSDKEMIESPQYKYYLEFWLRTESQRLKEWLRGSEINPSMAWQLLRIDTIPAAERESSLLYQAYVRYTKMLDDKLYQLLRRDKASTPSCHVITDTLTTQRRWLVSFACGLLKKDRYATSRKRWGYHFPTHGIHHTSITCNTLI
ncbi:unnamed protein product [Phytophthora fragariaefolia]|uniref:Unnamed protein product n=1 Tax=Phytophthora fragariaefolia TaxID=1490495 RepID=A0A9W7CZ44_9STRA|nr:unnamed protein product [Phytophthora fragariaefolia]